MNPKPQNRKIVKTLTPNSKLKADGEIQRLKALIKQSLVVSALAMKGLAEQENSGKSKPTAKTHREIKQAIAKLGKIISALTRK
jgi:hypothetical protein